MWDSRRITTLWVYTASYRTFWRPPYGCFFPCVHAVSWAPPSLRQNRKWGKFPSAYAERGVKFSTVLSLMKKLKVYEALHCFPYVFMVCPRQAAVSIFTCILIRFILFCAIYYSRKSPKYVRNFVILECYIKKSSVLWSTVSSQCQIQIFKTLRPLVVSLSRFTATALDNTALTTPE
jgi:hypothetical protein